MCNYDVNVKKKHANLFRHNIQRSVSSENIKFDLTTENSMQRKYEKYMGHFHFKTYMSIR
jgi:hypothetical protein